MPILKCYRVHIEKALSEYGPPPEKAKYPSLLDAVGALNPRTAEIKKHWIAYRDARDKLADASENEDRVASELAGLDPRARAAREHELAAAQDRVARAKGELLAAESRINQDSANLQADAALSSGERQQIARDVFYALSVAFRVELEALALIPIIVVQTVRGLPTAPRDNNVLATDVSTTVDRSPMQIKLTQVDVGYDVMWLHLLLGRVDHGLTLAVRTTDQQLDSSQRMSGESPFLRR